MDEIFGKRPETVPLAVASTSAGLTVKDSSSTEPKRAGSSQKRKAELEAQELMAKKFTLEERKVKALEDFNSLFKEFINIKKKKKDDVEEEVEEE